jgi:SNF2 family DNA or RNA helicase
MDELVKFSTGFFGAPYTEHIKVCVKQTSITLKLSENDVATAMMDLANEEMSKCLQYSKNKSLFDYQKDLVSLFYSQRGAIAAFATGTGKTLTATSSAACVHNLSKFFGKKCNILVVTPASLVDNMKEEFSSSGYNFGKDINVMSSNIFRDLLLYNKNIKQGVGPTDNKFMILNSKREGTRNQTLCNENTFLIIDEAHEFKTDYLYVFAPQDPRAKDTEDIESRAKMFVEECYPHVWKVLLLTATPMLNQWYDIMNLIAAVKGVNPQTQKYKLSRHFVDVNVDGTTFGDVVNKKSIQVEKVVIDDKNYFKNVIVFKDVDKTNENFPKRNPEVYMPVYMTPKYYALVTALLSEMKLKRPSKKKMTEEAIIKELEALQKKLAYLPDNPKIKIVKDFLLSDKYDKIIIYSRFLNPLKGLQENIDKDIKSGSIPKYTLFVITGQDVPPSKRQAYLKKINAEKKAIVFVSDAGGMGLDFKGLEAVIIYEPGINISREEQAIGRAVRYKSHTMLPIEKRRVDIYKLIMKYPPGVEEKSVTPDQSLAARAKSKELASNMFREELLKLNQ